MKENDSALREIERERERERERKREREKSELRLFSQKRSSVLMVSKNKH